MGSHVLLALLLCPWPAPAEATDSWKSVPARADRSQPPPFPEVPDATYGTSGGVAFVSYPSNDCTNVTATPVVSGEWLTEILCQAPINESCGALLAIDSSNAVVHRRDVNQNFRAWVGSSLTTDGEYIFVGSATPTLGTTNVEDRYLHGCSVTKFDRNLDVQAIFDPGDPSCYYLPFEGANEDAVSGEVVPDGEGLWVLYVRPNASSSAGDSSLETLLYRLDLSLQEQCRVGFP